jgi:hypothetical protein
MGESLAIDQCGLLPVRDELNGSVTRWNGW